MYIKCFIKKKKSKHGKAFIPTAEWFCKKFLILFVETIYFMLD